MKTQFTIYFPRIYCQERLSNRELIASLFFLFMHHVYPGWRITFPCSGLLCSDKTPTPSPSWEEQQKHLSNNRRKMMAKRRKNTRDRKKIGWINRDEIDGRESSGFCSVCVCVCVWIVMPLWKIYETCDKTMIIQKIVDKSCPPGTETKADLEREREREREREKDNHTLCIHILTSCIDPTRYADDFEI